MLSRSRALDRGRRSDWRSFFSKAQLAPRAIQGVVEIREEVVLPDLLQRHRSRQRHERLHVDVREENDATSTPRSLFGELSSETNARHSLMWYATTIRIAASVAIGMSAAHLPATSVMTRSVSECTIPASGERAPFLMFVAVRAIAPV